MKQKCVQRTYFLTHYKRVKFKLQTSVPNYILEKLIVYHLHKIQILNQENYWFSILHSLTFILCLVLVATRLRLGVFHFFRGRPKRKSRNWNFKPHFFRDFPSFRSLFPYPPWLLSIRIPNCKNSCCLVQLWSFKEIKCSTSKLYNIRNSSHHFVEKMIWSVTVRDNFSWFR